MSCCTCCTRRYGRTPPGLCDIAADNGDIEREAPCSPQLTQPAMISSAFVVSARAKARGSLAGILPERRFRARAKILVLANKNIDIAKLWQYKGRRKARLVLNCKQRGIFHVSWHSIRFIVFVHSVTGGG